MIKTSCATWMISELHRSSLPRFERGLDVLACPLVHQPPFYIKLLMGAHNKSLGWLSGSILVNT
jgi:hypothetical protein